MTATTATRWAVYGRISDDPTDAHAGVESQLRDGTALAKERGAEVVGPYRDDDISATSGKHRPGYTAMMRDAEAGAFTAIVVFHLSRLWRNRIERAQGIEALRKAGVSVIAVKGPALDLTTAAGRAMAGLLGEFDTMESDTKAERNQRAALRNAETGRPNGRLPYGWLREYDDDGPRDVHHPDQAPVVAEVCRRLLSGEPTRSITRWLNSSGIPAPSGREWFAQNLKPLAIRPANAGLRLYHDGRPDQQEFEARVQPIISREDWKRLRADARPRPAKGATRPNSRKYLLTVAIGECGTCGGPLMAHEAQRGRVPAAYKCRRAVHVSRNVERVDALVLGAVALRLSAPDALDLLVADEGSVADLALARSKALHVQKDQALDDCTDGIITREERNRIIARLRPQIEQADRQVATAAPSVPVELLRLVAGKDALKTLEALPVAQRHLLVGFIVGRVIIDPVKQNGRTFDPTTVRIVLRGAETVEGVALHSVA